MMFFRNLALVAATSLLMAAPAMADDAVQHFKGKPADTLEQALANFSEYNTQLENILASELTPVTMNEVHRLTYTLEIALEKMESELGELAETLERVHKASETSDNETVRSAGKAYLKTSRQFVK